MLRMQMQGKGAQLFLEGPSDAVDRGNQSPVPSTGATSGATRSEPSPAQPPDFFEIAQIQTR